MRLLLAASTDVGRVRKANEDSYCILEKHNSAYLCDGMGGHVAGAQASHLAIDTISTIQSRLTKEQLDELNAGLEPSLPDFAAKMIHGIRMANLRIFSTAQNKPELKGMGTTVVGVSFKDGIACIGHAGDSRVYRIRDEKIEQMTVDHSWLNELIQAGKLDQEYVKNFPHRNVIIRALGVENTVKIDIRLDPVQQGDYFILCSDGLHDLVDDEVILNAVLAYDDALEDAINSLILEANKAGGKDNITITLLKVLELDEPDASYQLCETMDEESTSQLAIEYRLLNELFGSDESDAETRPISYDV